MHTFRSFLLLGNTSGDLLTLLKSGIELLHCTYSSQQGIDNRGKAVTRVFGGNISLTMSQLPTPEITSWGLSVRTNTSKEQSLF